MVGTNIGGWLVLEPWITPSLFYRFLNKQQDDVGMDMWTFCSALGPDEGNRVLRDHWDYWLQEEHVAQLGSRVENALQLTPTTRRRRRAARQLLERALVDERPGREPAVEHLGHLQHGHQSASLGVKARTVAELDQIRHVTVVDFLAERVTDDAFYHAIDILRLLAPLWNILG